MGNKGDAFANYLAQNKQLVEDCVLAYAPAPSIRRDQTLDLDRYLYGPVVRFVSAGGKRIRPALCLLGAEAVGADPSIALPAAAAVELFQAAALIHDDIADQGTLRRGQPCMHITEGVGLAINAGDAALISVTAAIARNNDFGTGTRIRLLDEIITMEERTLEGQALDLGWARDKCWNLTASDYLEMARCKTAYYSAAVPLAIGAICGGGSVEQVEGLRHFGLRTGLAFQIQDDLLNLVGAEESTKKDFRNDITEGKRTLCVVHALEHSAKADRLIEILSSETHDPDVLQEAVDIMEESGSIAFARAYAENLTSIAKNHLMMVLPASPARDMLASMADWFVNRLS